jgi:methionyl-tRNA formyltransferase
LKRNEEIAGKIADCRPDMIVVAAYGNILPPEILGIPKLGCLNIHASLLPRWRGAAPVQRAVIEGDETTGVTIMYMAEGLDTGDILLFESTEIGRKTASELQNELADMGAELIVKAMNKAETGSLDRVPQDGIMATYAPMIFKAEGKLNFKEGPERIERLVRGLTPWPGAFTVYKGEMIKIWEAYATDKDCRHEAGTVTDITNEGIEVSAGGKTLLVTEVQAPGKKRMKIKEYLRGNKIEKFTILG